MPSKWPLQYMAAAFGIELVEDDPERMARDRQAGRERAVAAVLAVDAWNAVLAAGDRPLVSPTIEAAVRARRPWLRLYCAGCRQQYEIDLRKIVRPPDFPIMGLRAAMVCESMCRGDGPEPQLLGLEQFPFDRKLAGRP